MASLWRRAMIYLGLVDDEEFEDEFGHGAYGYEYDEAPQPERAVRAAPRAPGGAGGPAAGPPETSNSAVRTVAPGEGGLPAPQRPSVVRTMPQAAAKVHVVEPTSFGDAQEVGDRLKITQPVILNLQGLDRGLQRRLIDFSSGLAYALGGSMSRVHDEVFLVSPPNVEVSQEEKQRLQARGLYSE